MSLLQALVLIVKAFPIDMRKFSPTVPRAWAPRFDDYQRILSRRLMTAVAWLTLLMVPGLQLLEHWLGLLNSGIWWVHAYLRMPLLAGALLVIWLRYRYPEGDWPRGAAVLFSLALLGVGWIMLFWHYVTESGDIYYLSHSLTISTAAIPILASRGLRDLALIYLPPLLCATIAFWQFGPNAWQGMGQVFAYPLLAMVVGAVISEMLYRSHVHTFVATEQLRQSAMTDPLTGLLNRRAMDELLRAEHARYLRHQATYAVVLADVDRFKLLNDTHGHDVGDQVLIALSDRLRESLRAEDHVARWGGEEFLVLLQGVDADNAVRVAEKIRARVADTSFPSTAGDLPVTISLGVAVASGEVPVDAIIVRADEALYQAKGRGRNRTVLAER